VIDLPVPKLIAAMPHMAVIDMAVGVLAERLYCPTDSEAFYKCFSNSGLQDAEAAATGACSKFHNALLACVEQRNVNDRAQRTLEHLATVKCPKEVEAAQHCVEGKGKDCQKVTEAAYACGARHLLAVFTEDVPAP